MRVKTEEIFAFLGELEVEKENIKLENVAVKNISMDQNPMGSTENATLQAVSYTHLTLPTKLEV